MANSNFGLIETPSFLQNNYNFDGDKSIVLKYARFQHLFFADVFCTTSNNMVSEAIKSALKLLGISFNLMNFAFVWFMKPQKCFLLNCSTSSKFYFHQLNFLS